MKTFDNNIIDEIDWFAGTLLTDFQEPKDAAGRERMERLERDGKDLNHTYAEHGVGRDASTPGVLEAYDVVRTDIARRMSVDMKTSNDAGEFPELRKHPQFDSSVSFDPDSYATPMEERYRDSLGDSQPSRFDEAFARKPLTVETARELVNIGEKLTKDAPKSGKKDYVRALNDVTLPIDRLERILNQKDLSTDPEAKASYDIVAIDKATRLSVIMADVLDRGHLDASRLTKRESALIANPHEPQPAEGRGVRDQAKTIPAGRPPITSKGPDSDLPMIDHRNRGTGR